MVVDWVEFAGCAYPLPVQVLAHKGAAVIAHDYAVWIKHWDYFENEGVAEKVCLRILSHQKVYYTFHYPACISLTRVHT